MLPAPFLPLHLGRTHLRALGGLHATRRTLPFDRRTTGERRDRHDRRIAAHLDGIRAHSDEVIREASHFIHSPSKGDLFAGTLALLHLDPDRVVTGLDDAAPRLRLTRREAFPIVDALRNGPAIVGAWSSLTDPRLLDGASFHAPVPRGALLLGLFGPPAIRRAAFIAAGRHPSPPPAVASEIERTVANGEPEIAPIAALARALHDPASFPEWLEHTTKGTYVSSSRMLLLAAVFGDVGTAARIARAVEERGPTPRWIHALGLLGRPRTLHLVARCLASPDLALRGEALRSMHLAMGRWFVPEGSRPEASDEVLADEAVRAAKAMEGADERWLLGRTLADWRREPDGSSLAQWLLAVLAASTSHRFEGWDAILDEGYGGLPSWFGVGPLGGAGEVG